MTNRHERIQHYLDHMCVQVKAREVHNDLRDELGNHMEEMILDKEQEGYTEEEAIAYAIEQMGDLCRRQEYAPVASPSYALGAVSWTNWFV